MCLKVIVGASSVLVIGMFVYTAYMYSSLQGAMFSYYNDQLEEQPILGKEFIWLFPCVALLHLLLLIKVRNAAQRVRIPPTMPEEHKEIFVQHRLLMRDMYSFVTIVAMGCVTYMMIDTMTGGTSQAGVYVLLGLSLGVLAVSVFDASQTIRLKETNE